MRRTGASSAHDCETAGSGQRALWLSLGLSSATVMSGVWSEAAKAQFRPAPVHINTGSTATSKGQPVTFQADHVSYDDHAGVVTWTGNVQVWQVDHVLRADKITYDRNTGIIAATGNVASSQPDGSVLFSHYAELTGDMHEGIMTQVHAILPADNAKLAANGLRRTSGKINDLTRAVYTACEICAEHPTRAPFWQLRAYDATQDLEHQRIDFRDTYMDILGIPVFYTPFFSMTDPSAKRRSGFLMVGVTPHDRYLGTYFTIPYYWVIDDSSDITLQALIATKTGPQISALYRKELNFGSLRVRGGLAYDTHRQSGYTNDFGEQVGAQSDHGIQGYIFAKGSFSLTHAWRAGFDARLATSANYMRDYRIPGYGGDTLNSNVYVEGFGTGAYSKLDAQYYQGLNRGVIRNNELPFVLPHYEYGFNSQPDPLGGRLTVNSNDFYVYRSQGTRDQRAEVQVNWNRPFRNSWGQKFLVTARLDSMLYHASRLYQQPNYYQYYKSTTAGQVVPTLAVKMNWPFVRRFMKGHGSQILEPIAQAIYAPNQGGGADRRLPNEDSLNYEFTDTTLFALNRYQGTDRIDGGLRANVGVHGNWTWNGHVVDVLAGESFQEHVQRDRIPYSGLNHHLSDVVARARVDATRYFGVTGRVRIDPHTGRVDFADALFNLSLPHFSLNGGYVREPITPYYYYVNDFRNGGSPTSLYYAPTNELSGGVSTTWTNWHASFFARRALSRHEFATLGGDVGYMNDCLGLDLMYLKQYTEIGGQRRYSTVLLTLSLKTIGAFGMK
ncbi:LPS-assembly protein LptD [Acetobacter conturbans]|uniref:LPS-assembly protein LptD n=1 Tax=Acetobacter conturbans TaxID=1737472 RepID=A0ABX0K114_9PROT|nr:LPS assembly protein LptD [Acetobacter conturbans]NHN87429.1 LPS assembly protein LptD [Acetobacter conturbans]